MPDQNSGIWEELKRRNVVRVAAAYVIVAWLLLQVADVVLDNIEAPAWVFQAILLLLVIGFPVAIIFAWAFELTPEGLKKEKDVDRTESVTHLTGRKLDFTIIAVLTIAVVYFVADKFFWADDLATESQVTASIAVLPFVPLSSGENDGYFADGLTEEILNALTQLPELQVRARTSSFFFKGQNIPVPEIADRLNVVYVIEGSVRRDGEQLRITAQLIRASDDFHLWSQTYNRTLDDVFAVQEDIAENIAEALDVVLDDNARRIMRRAGIRDVGAFIAYQKGREAHAMAHDTVFIVAESLALADVYLDRALEAAPGLTMAGLLKTDTSIHIIVNIAARFREEEYAGEAQDTLAALREEYNLTLRLSPPGNQWDILDLERTLFSEDWSSLPGRIQKAMQPGGCPQLNWTNVFLVPFGWAEQSAEKSRETLACNPMGPIASYNLAMSFIWSGDPGAALHAVDEAENKGVSHPYLEYVRYWAMLAAGRVNDPMERGPGPKGSMLLYIRQILREALAGDPALARQMAEEFWSGPDANDYYSMWVAAVVGDRDRADQIAARIDTQPGSVVVLSLSVFTCFCGAPFDLETTPNYKARIEEAGFPWPPPKRIDYPTKTW